ncbi:hypothetical protein LWI28_006139 [Acer negundo]|uniref:DUF4283 domain-containing protein n=1 Tax=Acer negundo TaxID=4023 RepID=A0AAD5JRV8_ACENE|nr:hypothetical protein LWI28_006139 [Acer negundo]
MKILMMTVGYSSTRWESSIFCTDVSSVLKELRNRKILASSFYLGDKNILWTFKSFKDRDTFIRNRLLWEDHFSSVGLWSNAITPQSKLSWIEFGGIPLQCWCEKFFLSLDVFSDSSCSGSDNSKEAKGVNEASRLKNLNLVGPRSGELAATNLLSNHKPADNASHVRKDFQYKDVLTNGNGVFNVGTVVDQNDHLQITEDAIPLGKAAKFRKNCNLKKLIKPSSSIKRNEMNTCKDKSLLAQGVGEFGDVNSRMLLSKGRWNLEKEMTKVIEKWVAL